jgi:hypothetical protein
MEELLRKYKNSIKKILQDYVARDQPINDANIHSAEFLSSLEVIFRHGIQCMWFLTLSMTQIIFPNIEAQVSGSLVTLWNFFCQLSRLGGDIGLQGSLIEKEVWIQCFLLAEGDASRFIFCQKNGQLTNQKQGCG